MKINIKNTYDIVSKNETKEKISLEQILKDKNDNIILYFYPKDNTPWCTVENKDFTLLKSVFNKSRISLIWVSKDSISSHNNFIEKQDIDIELISDPELILHKELWAYGEKNNYWKIVMGVIRSTFLINKKGEVLKEWKNIRAKWHAERLLKELSN